MCVRVRVCVSMNNLVTQVTRNKLELSRVRFSYKVLQVLHINYAMHVLRIYILTLALARISALGTYYFMLLLNS